MKLLLLLAFLLLTALSASAQSITRIQVAGNASNGTPADITITVSSTTIGDLILVWASTRSNSVTTFTITDNAGNTYTPVTGYNNIDLSLANHAETDWFGYTKDAFGGVTTITINPDSAGSVFGSAGVYRSTNGWPANPVDRISKGTYGNGTSFSSGATAALSQASELAIGFSQFIFDPGTITPGGGFTSRDTSAVFDSAEHYFADQIVASAAALTFSLTTANSTDNVANIVTFQDNAGVTIAPRVGMGGKAGIGGKAGF